MTQKKIQAAQLDISGSNQSINSLTLGAMSGTDSLIFSNSSFVKVPYQLKLFASDSNNNLNLKLIPNGTAVNSTVEVFNSSDLMNYGSTVLWIDDTGGGLENRAGGSGTLNPMYFGFSGTGYALKLTPSLNVEVPGDISLTTAGKAIKGDFSNATATNRNFIQSYTTNGATRISVLPNGTGTTANVIVENSSSLVDSAYASLFANSTEAGIDVGTRGAGVGVPFNMYHNGTKAIAIGGASNTVDVRTDFNINSTLTLASDPGTAGQFLRSNGAGIAPIWATVAATPGGADSQIQYNSAGAFAGSSALTFTAGNLLSVGSGSVGGLTFIGAGSISASNGITIAPAAASTTVGYAINITGGTTTHATLAGGGVNITGAAANAAGTGGAGSALVTGGASSTTTAAATGSVRGGANSNTTTGAGGVASVIGGAQTGAASSGAGGNALLQSGAVTGAGATGSSGNVFLNVGTSTSGTYGRINLTVGGTSNIKFSTGSTGSLVIGTGTTNYGTTGQVLTSQGDAAPIWSNNFIANSLVLPKTSGSGIKVDTTTPTFAWQDLLGPIVVRGTGVATDPTLNTFINNVRAYQFTVNDYVEVYFHLGHDYVPGTDIYMHVHWGLNVAGTTSGGVTWEFETTYAKGHDQMAFGATKITTVTQAASTVQYQHMIAEIPISSAGGSATLLDNALFEPDGIFMIRVRLTANTVNGGPEPFAFLADMHYQSTGIGTKNKAPNFYA
jgi:hypothetical protein